MRKIVFAAVAALASATPAFAADSGDTQINASLAPTCSIVEQSSALTLGAVDEQVPGVFKYTCNFVGQPNLNFTSANGGVKTTENGGALRNYGIFLNDQDPNSLGYPSPQSWLQASQTPQSYPNISTSSPANSIEEPYFIVALTQPLLIAGSYTDTLTINIAP